MLKRLLAILAVQALVVFPWSVTICFLAHEVHAAFLLLYVALLPMGTVLSLAVADAAPGAREGGLLRAQPVHSRHRGGRVPCLLRPGILRSVSRVERR
jgi:hypothetical protein